jgi:serine/threonine protein kinase
VRFTRFDVFFVLFLFRFSRFSHPSLFSSPFIFFFAHSFIFILTLCLIPFYSRFGSQALLDANRQWLEKPENLAVRIVIALDVALGLVTLHERELAHQDLKLANILVFRDPTSIIDVRSKVADYGEARREQLDSSTTTTSTSPSVFQTQSQFGTFTHWSPQQFRAWKSPEKDKKKGVRVSRQHDIYSFGHILWEIFYCRVAYTHLIEQAELSAKVKEREAVFAVRKRELLARRIAEEIDDDEYFHLQADLHTDIKVMNEDFKNRRNRLIYDQKMRDCDENNYEQDEVTSSGGNFLGFGANHEAVRVRSKPKADRLPLPVDESCPNNWRKLMEWCWCYEPRERPTANQCRAALIRMLSEFSLPLPCEPFVSPN